MIQYIIYDHPKDFPDECVARKIFIKSGRIEFGELVARGKTVDEVREQLPGNVISLPVFEEDDPVIAEVWAEV